LRDTWDHRIGWATNYGISPPLSGCLKSSGSHQPDADQSPHIQIDAG
jgi:hypothetical protein